MRPEIMTAPKRTKPAKRNRTLTLTEKDRVRLRSDLRKLSEDASGSGFRDIVVNADFKKIAGKMPVHGYDLLFADPPYNLSKEFGSASFRRISDAEYEDYTESWLAPAIRLLRPSASVYICGDWRSGSAIRRVGEKHLKLRNRITWEREKGRGSKINWKNSSEDIWFFTVSDDYTFNVDDVRLKRRVIAPYRVRGKPKDWSEEKDGNFRLTHPSNLWTDLTVPFWSMRENTEHPTQKPEKLLARIILASTKIGDLILDPFLGSGTTAVAAKKLGRHFTGVEMEEDYCLLALRRLEIAETDKDIQGFSDGVFWDRNTNSGKKT